jgi:hypothetical protein
MFPFFAWLRKAFTGVIGSTRRNPGNSYAGLASERSPVSPPFRGKAYHCSVSLTGQPLGQEPGLPFNFLNECAYNAHNIKLTLGVLLLNTPKGMVYLPANRGVLSLALLPCPEMGPPTAVLPPKRRRGRGLTLDVDDTLAQALSLMIKENVERILVLQANKWPGLSPARSVPRNFRGVNGRVKRLGHDLSWFKMQ